MKDHDPRMSFDEDSAGRYDAEDTRGNEEATVDCLEQLAQGGPALELAIGTGRIALPLAARGVRVDGIDFSQPMVDQLRRKPGGDALDVTMGDFADVPVAGRYRLIYLVYNTLFNLLTQDDQVRCFENAAAHLEDGGVFVVEAFTPSWLHRLTNQQYVAAESIAAGRVVLDTGRHDPVEQTLDESHVEFTAAGIHLAPIACRYAWPSELDLMARIAGLRRRERWSTWERHPFTAESRNCISVWVR